MSSVGWRCVKSSRFSDKLAAWLNTEAGMSRKQRRTPKQVLADPVALGFTGFYGRVAAFARDWRANDSVSSRRRATAYSFRCPSAPIRSKFNDFQNLNVIAATYNCDLIDFSLLVIASSAAAFLAGGAYSLVPRELYDPECNIKGNNHSY